MVKPTYHQKQMQDEWESWEHLLLDDFRRIERRIQTCYVGMQLVGVGREEREKFVIGKLRDLVQRVAEGA